MRQNSKDSTIERNLIRDWQHKCQEYEQVKAGKHPKFRFMADFYKHHNTHRQVFLKYYHRYKASGDGRTCCHVAAGLGECLLPTVDGWRLTLKASQMAAVPCTSQKRRMSIRFWA